MGQRVPIIDLFAGAGGIGIGANLAGGDLRLSVELEPICCQTLRLNHKHHPGAVIEADVSTLSGAELRARAGLTKADPLIIVGGPPCQPFSKAAYWTDPGNDSRYRRARARGVELDRPAPITKARPDDRRDLVGEFLNRISEAKADGFMFENVPSITHPRNRSILESLIQRAEAMGFKTTFLKANAAEFGVAQRRERVFLLGARRMRPNPPISTHSLETEHGVLLRPAVTAGEALRQIDSQGEPEEIVTGRWAKEFHEIPPGWNYKALTAWAGHPRPVFEAETRFWNFLLKLSPDKPSWTIAANPGPWIGPFHWKNRRLRTSEMAALQSFPRDYVFAGNRRQRVRQIGNAAPPLLVKKMVEQVIAAVVGDREPSAQKHVEVFA